MMKRTVIALMVLMFVALAASAYAVNVEFNPQSVKLDVLPGEKGSKYVQINASAKSALYVSMVMGANVTSGNLPAAWIVPASVNLSSRNGVASGVMLFEVAVPAEAEGGTYTASLLPEVLKSSEMVDAGGGLYVVVEVPSKGCAGAPKLMSVVVGPENIWAPQETEASIDLSGMVDIPAGCDVTVGYRLESDSGEVRGLLGVDGGRFAEKVKITVSKDAKEKAGRTYNGVIYAVDNDNPENSDEQGFFVKVAHDNGKKNGQNK